MDDMYSVNKEAIFKKIKKSIVEEIKNMIDFYIKNENHKYEVKIIEEDKDTLIYEFKGFEFQDVSVSESVSYRELKRIKDWSSERKQDYLLQKDSRKPCIEASVKVPFSIYIYTIGQEISLTFREKDTNEYIDLFKEKTEEIRKKLVEEKASKPVSDLSPWVDINLKRIEKIQQNSLENKNRIEYFKDDKIILDPISVIFWDISHPIEEFLNSVNKKLSSYCNYIYGYNMKFY